jgi:hypothetical protein
VEIKIHAKKLGRKRNAIRAVKNLKKFQKWKELQTI